SILLSPHPPPPPLFPYTTLFRSAKRILDGALLTVVYPAILAAALLERRRRRERPRVFWGTAPLISIKYHQQAIRLFGYETVSVRSEEHTSELQSRGHLVCRLLLE